MTTHASRFPGSTNDPSTEILSPHQARRFAALAEVSASALEGKTLAAIGSERALPIDPTWLLFRTVCGRVVKADSNGVDHPVGFATVHVYDTDVGVLGWSPRWSRYTWFFRFPARRRLLRTVTTDECGRFCVRIPRWEIEYYVRWRLERECFFRWLRRPTIRDILVEEQIGPLDPGPLHIDEHVLVHASRVLGAPALARLRTLSATKLGDLVATTAGVLDSPAVSGATRPPLDAQARTLLAPERRGELGTRAAIDAVHLEKLDLESAFGPFLRCRTVVVPEWYAVRDIPDLTFEVTQDVNGDGVPEVIYQEGLFDVRWDAGELPAVTLHASSLAITGIGCGAEPPVSKIPAILLAANYPLQQAGFASSFQDGISGYARLPNRPDSDGDPATSNRTTPAQAPFTGSFYLQGYAEATGATHYRIAHTSGGVTGFLNQGFGPLLKSENNLLKQLNVYPVDGQWYPIVPRSEGWTPAGLLAPVYEAGNRLHEYQLEMGTQGPTGIALIPNSLTKAVRIFVDTTAPDVHATLAWRHPDTAPGAWKLLEVGDCPVVQRTSVARVQFRFTVAIAANHLRDYAITAGGCGSHATPLLIQDGRDGLPIPPATAAAHWHMSPGDNAAHVTLHYELAADAPAGCYSFGVSAQSRAFDPNTTVAITAPATPEDFWRGNDQSPVYTRTTYSVAVQ